MNRYDDYLDVAIGESKEQILKNHWQKVLETRTWVSVSGTKIPFEQLDEAHLKAIVKMLISFDNRNCLPLAIELLKILNERGC